MKRLYVAVFLLLGSIVEFSGAQLQSSVGNNALCPGERVTFTCTVDSNVIHDWRLRNGSAEQEIDAVTTIAPNAANLGFELTIPDVTTTPITSTATVTTTTDLNGTVIVCTNANVANLLEQNATIDIIGVPTAPIVTMVSESSRTNNNITIRVILQQPVYGFECIQNCTVIVRADGEEDLRVDCTLPGDVFVQVSVCPKRYTFTAVACSSVGCSVESAPVTLDATGGLLRVTNIASVSGNLSWTPPQNAPPGCVTNYTITWDDGNFTTPDNRNSTPFDDIPGLEVCRTYTSIVVTPIVPPFGPIQSSSGIGFNVDLIPSDFPTPSSLQVETSNDASGIIARLDWNVIAQSMDTTVDVSVGYSRSNDTCSSSVQVAQNVSGPDIPTTTQVLLNDSFITCFCVVFTLRDCERRDSDSIPFPRVIARVDHDASTTSVVLNITYSSTLRIGLVPNFIVRVILTTGSTTDSITGQEVFSFPNQSILLSPLQPGTNYMGTVEVVSDRGAIIHSIQITFTTDSERGSSVGAIAGGTVGAVIGLGVTAGALLGVLCCYKIKKGKKGRRDEDVELKEPSPDSSPAADSGPPPAVYADPNTIQREEFPGTQDVYTVPDKKKKKHKPEDHLPTYQDPSTISHEVAPTGDMYAQPDKPRKPRGSKKNQQEAPPPTEEQLAEMYSQPDKSKKQQSQGLTYTHIDFRGSGRVPDTQPGVVYSDVKPQ